MIRPSSFANIAACHTSTFAPFSSAPVSETVRPSILQEVKSSPASFVPKNTDLASVTFLSSVCFISHEENRAEEKSVSVTATDCSFER